MSVLQRVLDFVDAVNTGDVARICDFMTEDHLFVDSDGTEVRGRERMRQGWLEYFRMMRHYRIEVQETFCTAATVVLIGTATGTYVPDATVATTNRWTVPAAWRAVVRDDLVAVWQVFVNPEPIRRVMHQGTNGRPNALHPTGVQR